MRHPSDYYVRYLLAASWNNQEEPLTMESVNQALSDMGLLEMKVSQWDYLLSSFNPPQDFLFNNHTEIKSWSTVWDINLETNKDHAVGFPTELPLRCIRACSNEKDIIGDPFLGSGTTMVACENLKRCCRGVEIEPKYVAVALQRMADAFPKLKIKKL